MVTAISLLWLKGWHAPAGRRTCETPASCQARQIRPAAPVGATKTWARPTDRFEGQPQRRQPNRRSGRDPGPDPTPTPPQNRGSRAGSTTHILPAEYALPVDAGFVMSERYRTTGSGVQRLRSRPAYRAGL